MALWKSSFAQARANELQPGICRKEKSRIKTED